MLPSPLSSRMCGLVTLPPGTVNEVVYVWEEGVRACVRGRTLDLTLYRVSTKERNAFERE